MRFGSTLFLAVDNNSFYISVQPIHVLNLAYVSQSFPSKQEWDRRTERG